MNEEQIVLSLIALYKREGVDVHQLLDEPLFNALPVQRRVELVKMYAQQLHDGIKTGLTRRDAKNFLKDVLYSGAMGGATGFAAVKALSRSGMVSPASLTAGIFAGLGTGVAISTLKNMDRMGNKHRLKSYFGLTAKNPTDSNAIQSMGFHNLRTRVNKEDSEVFNKVLQRMDEYGKNNARNQAERYIPDSDRKSSK
jgi:hypothetical protein